jgi:serine O-acetyltransferase
MIASKSLTSDEHSRARDVEVSAIWEQITLDARAARAKDPALEQYLNHTILDHKTLAGALVRRLSCKLAESPESRDSFEALVSPILARRDILSSIIADLKGTVERDAACPNIMAAFLNYKGFFALTAYRIAHELWTAGRDAAALFIQLRVSEVWSVDIHPAAKIGCGIFIDHGTGLVIGETAVVEDCVSLLHGVTLGGTGKHHGDRHPKIRKGVLIGAGAKLLGNIEVGAGSRIGAGSVVLASVPPHCTAVGVPARVIPQPANMEPALEMDHSNWII